MNMYVILSSTCFGPWHAHLQEEQLYKHSIWYPRSTRQLHDIHVHIEVCIKVGSKKISCTWHSIHLAFSLHSVSVCYLYNIHNHHYDCTHCGPHKPSQWRNNCSCLQNNSSTHGYCWWLPWKQSLVAPWAACFCVTVAGTVQWLCVLVGRWQRERRLLRVRWIALLAATPYRITPHSWITSSHDDRWEHTTLRWGEHACGV